MKNKISSQLDSFLKGIGQIMLQENAITGLLFLLGIFYGSLSMGIGCMLAVVTGQFAATIFGYEKSDIRSGLYGFNPALIGVALPFFMESTLVLWIAIVLGSVIATIIQNFFMQKKFPGFTFPFILVTWLILYVFHNLYLLNPASPSMELLPFDDEFATVAHGFGEVIFQGSAIAGILFFLAVFISSPIAALYGFVASGIAAALSLHLSEPANDIHIGLFSFNAVLCAITFAGPKVRDGVYVLLAVVLSVFIDIAMVKMNLSVLTFPFVSATWIVLLVKKFIPQKVAVA